MGDRLSQKQRYILGNLPATPVEAPPVLPQETDWQRRQRAIDAALRLREQRTEKRAGKTMYESTISLAPRQSIYTSHQTAFTGAAGASEFGVFCPLQDNAGLRLEQPPVGVFYVAGHPNGLNKAPRAPREWTPYSQASATLSFLDGGECARKYQWHQDAVYSRHPVGWQPAQRQSWE